MARIAFAVKNYISVTRTRPSFYVLFCFCLLEIEEVRSFKYLGYIVVANSRKRMEEGEKRDSNIKLGVRDRKRRFGRD